MTDEPFDGSGPPVRRPPQGLRSQTNSLVRRGLDLVTTSTERMAEARKELALARHFLDLSERLLNEPISETYPAHSIDVYRYGLSAMAILLRVNRGEGPVDCANNLLRQTMLVPHSLPPFTELLPEVVMNAFDLLPEVVKAFEGLESDEWLKSDRSFYSLHRRRAQERSAADALHIVATPAEEVAYLWSFPFAIQKAFIEDVGELIERPSMRTRPDGTVEVLFPDLGDTPTRGTMVRWFKSLRQAVGLDEALFETSTENFDAEIPSPVAGVLTSILVAQGESVAPYSIVGIIEPHSAADPVLRPMSR